MKVSGRGDHDYPDKKLNYENNLLGLLLSGYILCYIPKTETAGTRKGEMLEKKDLNIKLTTSSRPTAAPKLFRTIKGHVSFFAEAPVSDVDARNDQVKIRLDASTGELLSISQCQTI